MGPLKHFKLCVSKTPDFSSIHNILGKAMKVYSRWAVMRWRHPNLVPVWLRVKKEDHPKLMCPKVLLRVEGLLT